MPLHPKELQDLKSGPQTPTLSPPSLAQKRQHLPPPLEAKDSCPQGREMAQALCPPAPRCSHASSRPLAACKGGRTRSCRDRTSWAPVRTRVCLSADNPIHPHKPWKTDQPGARESRGSRVSTQRQRVEKRLQVSHPSPKSPDSWKGLFKQLLPTLSQATSHSCPCCLAPSLLLDSSLQPASRKALPLPGMAPPGAHSQLQGLPQGLLTPRGTKSKSARSETPCPTFHRPGTGPWNSEH